MFDGAVVAAMARSADSASAALESESELKEAWVKFVDNQSGVVKYVNCGTREFTSARPPEDHIVMSPAQYEMEKLSYGRTRRTHALFKKRRIGLREPVPGTC